MTHAAPQYLTDPRAHPQDPHSPAVWVIESPNPDVLAELLAERLNTAPAAITFTTDAFGRRALSPDTLQSHPAAATLDFSISRRGNICVIGICPAGRFGVDIELLPAPPTWRDTASDCCCESELNWILTHDKQDQPEAFLQIWTAKEATGKALGLGLNTDPRNTELAECHGQLTLVRIQGHASLATGWTLHQTRIRMTDAIAVVSVVIAHAVR